MRDTRKSLGGKFSILMMSVGERNNMFSHVSIEDIKVDLRSWFIIKHDLLFHIKKSWNRIGAFISIARVFCANWVNNALNDWAGNFRDIVGEFWLELLGLLGGVFMTHWSFSWIYSRVLENLRKTTVTKHFKNLHNPLSPNFKTLHRVWF